MKKDILTNYFKVRNRELLATTEPNVYFITLLFYYFHFVDPFGAH